MACVASTNHSANHRLECTRGRGGGGASKSPKYPPSRTTQKAGLAGSHHCQRGTFARVLFNMACLLMSVVKRVFSVLIIIKYGFTWRSDVEKR